MKVETHLNFEGKCEQALTFYQKLLGIEVSMLMKYRESPDQSLCPEGFGDKVMHANFKIGETAFMASDGGCTGKPNFSGFSLSFNAESETEAQRIIKGLSEGGKVTTSLASSFWGGLYGEVTDQFGLTWMISVFG
ncbi:VOC family protein [Alteromonas sp. a30]|uniref:VOC family protein n=1 Tax=Alteromonas sp. a30 TaxID=2730917 RepID=UPI00228141FD|nr:VOC family protein [Alteromonas sp. a30]MCY7295391.1 VOC family protein [Alteromonas sp. a30]